MTNTDQRFMEVDVDQWNALVRDKRALLATNKALRVALESALSACETAQTMYDKVGPQWTSPEGNEYESTSIVLAGYNELAEIINDALKAAKAEETQKDG